MLNYARLTCVVSNYNNYIMLYYISSDYIILYDTILCCVVLHYVMLYLSTLLPYDCILRYTMLCYVLRCCILWYIRFYHVISQYHGVPWYVLISYCKRSHLILSCYIIFYHIVLLAYSLLLYFYLIALRCIILRML